MANNYYPPIRKSRVQQHAKRKKTNFILNILIGIITIAILVVGGNILFGGDDDNSQEVSAPAENDNKDHSGENENPNEDKDEPATGEDEPEEDPNQSGTDPDSDNEENDPIDEPKEEDEESDEPTDELITEQSDDPNVIQAVVNPNWEPVGTVQTGEHVTQYGEGTADRSEMEQALAYAVNTSSDNLIYWWLETGEVFNKHVIGTVSKRDDEKIYRVYLEWVDGQGWKPTRYEELKENDKR